MPTSQKVLH